jgi:hypothetical protein
VTEPDPFLKGGAGTAGGVAICLSMRQLSMVSQLSQQRSALTLMKVTVAINQHLESTILDMATDTTDSGTDFSSAQV